MTLFRASRIRRLPVMAAAASLAVLLPAGLATAASASSGAAPARSASSGSASAGAASASTASPSPSASTASCPWLNQSLTVAQRVQMLLAKMTLANKINMVTGAGTSQPYVFYISAIPSLCIPAMGEEDGPVGVGDGLTGVTELPSAVSLAATWDPALATQYGKVVGSEERGKGAMVNLGPTVNIDRDPRWGRSFEAYTEDPYLNAALTVSDIDGVQSQGEMSQVKHFALYNQETNRNTPADDVIVSQRAEHEIYLPAFWAATKQAHASSVMCSYATINGQYACQNDYLLHQTLDQRWKFPGFVTSDYGATHSTVASADAGNDQEMPSAVYYGPALQAAVQAGQVSMGTLNGMVSRILTELFRFNEFNNPPTGSTTATVTTPAHQATSAAVAEAGTVLLKNSGGTLPLKASGGGSVAVIGPAASASPCYTGGGSAYVTAPFHVTPLQGIQAAAGTGTSVSYTQGLPTDTSLTPIPSSALSPAYAPTGFGGTYTGTLTAPETGTYVLAFENPCGCYTSVNLSLDGKELLANPGTPPVSTYSVGVHLVAGQTYTLQLAGGGESANLSWATPSDLAPGISQAVAAAKSASSAVVVVSDDTETEAADRPSLNLPSAQNELISAVAAANPHTVVVVNAGAPVAMPWLSQVASVVDAWYPGESNGTALAAVLFGAVDPSGHLPVTFPVNLSQVPASTPAQFPGVNGKVLYSEGIDVGYRYYDAHHETPLFPFGYGLSYTSFRFSDLRITRRARQVTVSATVTNTGRVAGVRRRPAVPERSGGRRRATPAAEGLPEGHPPARAVRHRPLQPGRATTCPTGTAPRTGGSSRPAGSVSTWVTRPPWPDCRCRAGSPWLGDRGQHLGNQDSPERVAQPGDPGRDVPDRERVRPRRRVVQLVPFQRSGHRRPGRGARAVGRDQGLVARVLRVVEPGQAAPVVHVPLPAHQPGHDGADRPGQLLHPGPGLGETRPRGDRDPDLDAAPAGELGLAPHAQVLQRGAVQPGQDQHLVPRRGRAGIDVDERVTGLVRLVGPGGPGVPLQGAEVGRPHQRGRLVGDQVGAGLAGLGTGIVPARHPVRRVVGQLLVPEPFRLRAAREAVHVQRQASQVRQHHRGDLRRVPDELALGHRGLARDGRGRVPCPGWSAAARGRTPPRYRRHRAPPGRPAQPGWARWRLRGGEAAPWRRAGAAGPTRTRRAGPAATCAPDRP